MNKTAWTILGFGGAIVMAALAAVSVFSGGCQSLLELANGSSTFMKCHWTFVANTYVGMLGTIVSLFSVSCKDQSARRFAGIILVACALVAGCMPTSFGIGLCANPEMHCHTTATITWILCALAAIVGIVQVVKSNPDAAQLPKRAL